MNRDQFEKAMNGLDEKFVAEAVEYKKPAKWGKIVKIGSLAACAVLVMVGIVGMVSGGKAAEADNAAARTDDMSYYTNGPDYAAPAKQNEYSEAKDGEIPRDSLGPGAPEDSKGGGQDTNTAGSIIPIDADKIIYTAKISMESKEFEKSCAELEKIVSELGGYFEDKSVYDQGVRIRKATMTIRVPKEQFQTAMERLQGIAHVTFSNQSAQNVSKEYYDIQSRLDTAKIKLERLQGLLKQASDMADIIELENAISNVEWEIDSYSGSLKNFDSKIGYSTIQVELLEVLELSDTTPEPVSFGARIKKAFVYGFENIGDSLVAFVEWFVGNIFWLALIAGGITIAVKVIKKKRRAL